MLSVSGLPEYKLPVPLSFRTILVLFISHFRRRASMAENFSNLTLSLAIKDINLNKYGEWNESHLFPFNRLLIKEMSVNQVIAVRYLEIQFFLPKGSSRGQVGAYCNTPLPDRVMTLLSNLRLPGIPHCHLSSKPANCPFLMAGNSIFVHLP